MKQNDSKRKMQTMKKHTTRRRGLLAVLAATAALAFTLLPATHGRAAPPAITDCEGDACAQVTLTFDEAKGQYLAQNNSSDRWMRVTASNVAAASSVCLAPGKAAHLSLKSIVSPYRATYAPVKCGEEDPAGPPAGE